MKKMMISLAFVLAACAGRDTSKPVQAETPESTSAPVAQTQSTTPKEPPMAETATTSQVVEMKTSKGTIVIRFFPDVAPGHVKNFLELSKSGFYNGVKFHRVIPGFMIQGGDPNTKNADQSAWGTGGSGKNLKAEFNKIHHKRGIVSAARSGDPNSASSQFFIVVADSGFLDNQYTVFGEVVSGMDVADKIVSAPKNSRDVPNEPVSIESMTIREAKEGEKGPTPQ